MNTNLSYEEAKNYMLRKIPVKLPDWKGYWIADDKGNIQEHRMNQIKPATNIKYSFHNNWEIATLANCPVLRKEQEAEKSKPKVELIDIHISPLTDNILFHVRINGEAPTTLDANEIANLIGEYEVDKLINQFTVDNFAPQVIQPEFETLFDVLADIVDTIDFIENPSRVELPKFLQNCETPASMISALLDNFAKGNENPYDTILQLKHIIDKYGLGDIELDKRK